MMFNTFNVGPEEYEKEVSGDKSGIQATNVKDVMQK